MKHIWIAIFLTMCIEYDAVDKKVVETYVYDAPTWLQEAWNMKAANRRQEFIKAEVDRSIRDREQIPAGEAAIIEKALKRPDYKSRKEREGK